MSGRHFAAFLWLRWRLFANQMTRGGVLSQVLLGSAGVAVALAALAILIGSFLLGLLALPHASPLVLLLIWDGLALWFLFNWSVGLITELQRSEALSLDKFLHLPVSLFGAFALNYVSSLACVTMLLILPAMFGLLIGTAFGAGPMFLFVLPAALAFLFMVTALSYQFQGWLASLMVNKRRRRTIVVIVSLIFVLIVQLPNLINLFQPWQALDSQHKDASAKRAELGQALKDKKISAEEYHKALNETRRAEEERTQGTLEAWKEEAWLANMAIPLGWLAWGAAAALEGNPLPALLAACAYGLVGVWSLRRAYRTTLRMYTGQFTAAKPAAASAGQPAVAPPPVDRHAAAFLEKKLPLVSEQAAAIALAGLRSLLRAPEVKLLLLSPIIIIVVLGGMFLRGVDAPEPIRPLAAFGAMAAILFSISQLAANQFGYDRAGFRIFVLSPIPRREILLGKNLALAPLLVVLACPVLAAAAFAFHLRFDQVLALPFQFTAMFLIYAMAANLLSILAPMPVAAGSLKPLTPKVVPMLLHMVFVFAMPIALAPVLLPWGIEAGLEALGWSTPIPLAFILILAECAALVGIFRVVLSCEGALLQRRERQILEAVVTKAE